MGSQAINIGTNLVSAIVTDDIDGVMRPNNSTYDIGAYEFVHNNVSVEVNSSDELLVFPNPSSDYFILNYDTPQNITSIRLIDINGKIIKAFNASKNIDVTDVNSGIYLLQVEINHNKTINKKVSIK